MGDISNHQTQLQQMLPIAERSNAVPPDAAAAQQAEKWKHRTSLKREHHIHDETGRADLRAMKGQPLSSEEEDVPCPICLEPLDTQNIFNKVTLSCRHKFCLPCLTTYAVTTEGTLPGNLISCPCCRAEVQKPRILVRLQCLPQVERNCVLLPVEPGQRYAPATVWHEMRETETACPRGRGAPRTSPDAAPWWRAGQRDTIRTQAEQAALVRAAGHIDLRCCPSCSSPISKNGGCNMMRCPCGAHFRWNEARPLRPCTRCHYDPDDGFNRRWSSCRYCSRRAKAQATACTIAATGALLPRYTAVATGAVAGVSVAIAVSAVPAAIFGPLALAEAAVRRSVKSLRGTDNKLVYLAASGLALSAIAIGSVIGYDSD